MIKSLRASILKDETKISRKKMLQKNETSIDNLEMTQKELEAKEKW